MCFRERQDLLVLVIRRELLHWVVKMDKVLTFIFASIRESYQNILHLEVRRVYTFQIKHIHFPPLLSGEAIPGEQV